MTDTDFLQPDLGPLRAAAEAAELAQAVAGLVSIDGCRLSDSDPLAPLACDIARSMTEAGLTVHHRARRYLLHRLGGVPERALCRAAHALTAVTVPRASSQAAPRHTSTAIEKPRRDEGFPGMPQASSPTRTAISEAGAGDG